MEIIRHGIYVCLRGAVDAPVEALAERLGLVNEFHARGGDPPDSIAFLRRVAATPGTIDDRALHDAPAIVHVASGSADRVAAARTELARMFDAHVLAGVVRMPRYTGGAMHEFAYAHRVQQRSGTEMPDVFVLPLTKTAAWWDKPWYERHTYFLPRYGDDGRMRNEGHALAAAAGVPHLMRRTYQHHAEPAPAGSYDFITYFECATTGVPVFHQVCAALRDPAKNPEWQFVREGPTWHGRRVATWAELF